MSRWSKKKKPKRVYRRRNDDLCRSSDNLPAYMRNVATASPRTESKTAHKIDPDACARNTMMEKVTRGVIESEQVEEIVRKSRSLAPAYNKGAYQYVGTLEQARDAGRKNPSGGQER